MSDISGGSAFAGGGFTALCDVFVHKDDVATAREIARANASHTS